jgi:hypothetical protein
LGPKNIDSRRPPGVRGVVVDDCRLGVRGVSNIGDASDRVVVQLSESPPPPTMTRSRCQLYFVYQRHVSAFPNKCALMPMESMVVMWLHLLCAENNHPVQMPAVVQISSRNQLDPTLCNSK